MARGFHEYALGELVETDEINDLFIKQGILYFADATARDTAVTSPEEGMHAYLADARAVTSYRNGAWRVVPGEVTTAGDLIYFNGSRFARIGLGTPGQVFTVPPSGSVPEWAASTAGATIVRKTADESVLNSTILQDDDALLFAVNASEVHQFKMLLFASGGSSPGLKLSVAGPTGASAKWRATYFQAAFQTSQEQAIGATVSSIDATYPVTVEGLVVVGGTAGSVTLRWAQDSASAGTATTVKADSHLIYQRLA